MTTTQTTQMAQVVAVMDAARAASPVWEGDDRVTLRDAYEACRAQGTDDGCSWEDFGALCVSLARAGLIRLTRWDLSNDPERRAATEVQDGSSTYHFLATGRASW